MYLKEIEISGFKSFADKINIKLDNNITCIVGPNGSGKSNVVDAVRFVLGEQSVKSLRGESLMSDVIFGGSKNRNPMHVASVTLIFDNSDNFLNLPYKEVSIKRRLYKTGENEYFLNGDKCRLKDIVDLLLDSNIGRDSFNIIGQGEIARILSNSSLERRIVIEEASGILKYKKRREEALKKLDKTNSNLDRVNDIIIEVEARVNPLKVQSEKAKKYLDIKEKLNNIELSLLVSEITNFNIDYQDTKEKIKNLENDLISLENKINNPEIESLKLKSVNLERKLQDLNNNLVILAREKEEINSKRLVLKERNKYDKKDIKIVENINYLKDKKLELTNNLKISEVQLNDIIKNKKDLEAELSTLIDNLNSEKNRYDNTIKEYHSKEKEIFELKNKIEISNDNLKENVYLNSSVKKVLDNPKLTGIIDALINLIKIDSRYEKALGVVTLNNKNFIIAKNNYAINEAIDYLKSNKLGRATFLPLDIIKAKYIDSDYISILKDTLGYLGIFSDFLEYDKTYENIVLNQFGNIILCDNIENANKISKIVNNRFRIVTLDGDIIHVGGSVTGGYFDNIKNNLNIKNKLDDMYLDLKIKENVISSLKKDLDDYSTSIDFINSNINKKRSNLIEILNEMNLLKTNIEKYNKEKQDIEIELNSLEGDNNLISNIDKDYYNKSLEYELLEKEIKDLIKEKDLVKEKIEEYEGIEKSNRFSYQKLEKELNELKIVKNNLDIKLDNNLNILNSEYNLTYESAREKYTLEIELDEARDAVNNYKRILKEIGMVNLDSIDEYEEVNKRYLYLTHERDDLFHAKDMLYSIIDEMDDVMKTDFIKTFKELQIEFKKVFKSMFKGGDASLELTDHDNILETGIDIIASPPGKKLKTVTLLSGGEKTLTAISLLFAILNIRKVPFCIFDEVEAALDEANVDNFGTYLNNYKEKTQFLLITHKKRTMEYAKTLYGITMQESGVSKLVSVKLEK